ncbi:MAG: glutamate racemase [Bradymonadaceae bacterium]|nr:glutamate racemase [Lujinxingiaceae bacterium]
MNRNDRPIAIFDSGVGGLTVMRAVVEALPSENVIYLGDTARVPYGNRGADTVRRYALNATEMLRSMDIKALVVACNTATAYALPALLERHALPIVGVVEPVARRAAALTKTGVIAVMGTRGTVLSQSYPQTLCAINAALTVHQVACPLLVPLAEEGWTSGSVAETIIESYLVGLQTHDVDTLILGCTHYPLLGEAIARVVARRIAGAVTLLDSAATTAQSLKETLQAQGLLRAEGSCGQRRFLLTDIPDGFVSTASRFFGGEILSCEHVDIVDMSAMTSRTVGT